MAVQNPIFHEKDKLRKAHVNAYVDRQHGIVFGFGYSSKELAGKVRDYGAAYMINVIPKHKGEQDG